MARPSAILDERPETALTRERERQRVDATSDLLAALDVAMRSRKHTVQVMPEGCEIIEVDTGRLVRTVALVDVTPMERT